MLQYLHRLRYNNISISFNSKKEMNEKGKNLSENCPKNTLLRDRLPTRTSNNERTPWIEHGTYRFAICRSTAELSPHFESFDYEINKIHLCIPARTCIHAVRSFIYCGSESCILKLRGSLIFIL